jgi:hypothetical protein
MTLASRFEKLLMEWIEDEIKVNHSIKNKFLISKFVQNSSEKNKYPKTDHQNKNSQWQISGYPLYFQTLYKCPEVSRSVWCVSLGPSTTGWNTGTVLCLPAVSKYLPAWADENLTFRPKRTSWLGWVGWGGDGVGVEKQQQEILP